MAKKRKFLKKTNNKKSKTNNKKLKTNNKKPFNNNKVKIYKINGTQKKEQGKARREKNIQTFLVVLIIILAIAAIFSAIQTFFPTLFGRMSLGGELAARVNGHPIVMQELDTEYGRLPLQYQQFITKEAFLGQLIDETLMTQEAGRRGLTVGKDEIDESINSFIEENNITEDKLDDILKEKNLSYAELRNLISNQLLIDKLLEDEVKSKINVTTAVVLQYYNENPDSFRIPELITTRHILINLVNRTEEQAEERADMVFDLVKNDTARFCSYVWLYTDDAGSSEKCGEYTFPRGQMVEEFENRAFEQDIGEMSIVKTSFGYHILMTINKTPEQLIPFKDVQEQITLILEKQQEKMLYSDFIAGLREQAKIINYLEEKKEEVEEELVEEEVLEEEVIEPEPVSEEEAEVTTTEVVEAEEVEELEKEEEEVEEETEEAEEVEELEEIAEEQAELEEEVEEAIEEVVEEEDVIEDLSFAECLAYKGAVLYGAYWDSSTKKQKAYFGADVNKITYVECGVEGDYRAQEAACADAGILAYPTWVINDQKHMGIMEPAQLSALTGCEV